MHSATIEVSYVNPPKSEKGPGNIKDSDGNYWKVWPDMLAKFKAGGTYTVSYTKDDYQGKEQRTIKAVEGASSPSEPQRRPQAAVSGGATNDAKSEDMACMSCCGRYLGGLGQGGIEFPTSTELERMFRSTRLAWRKSLEEPKPANGALDDEIPFP